MNDPASLQLLYADPLDLSIDAIRAVLHDYHPCFHTSSITLEIADDTHAVPPPPDVPPVALTGDVKWNQHTVHFVGCDAPMPYGPLETCVFPAMMAPETKDEARQHRSHVMLYYTGQEPHAREQYVALAAVAGAFAKLGAIVILNEEARASVPAFELMRDDADPDMLAVLRELPIPYLWGGFLKIDIGDAAKPWIRTFANHRFGLPNLATHLAGHHETSQTFMRFAGILAYLEEQSATLEPGETIDLGSGVSYAIREPSEAEWWLDSPGPMLVLTPIQK